MFLCHNFIKSIKISLLHCVVVQPNLWEQQMFGEQKGKEKNGVMCSGHSTVGQSELISGKNEVTLWFEILVRDYPVIGHPPPIWHDRRETAT